MSHAGANQHVFQENEFRLLQTIYFDLNTPPKQMSGFFSINTGEKFNNANIFRNAKEANLKCVTSDNLTNKKQNRVGIFSNNVIFKRESEVATRGAL